MAEHGVRAVMRVLFAFSGALLVLGCAGTSPETDEPVEEMTPMGPVKPTRGGGTASARRVEFASCKAHLDAIADCFHKVVTQIQEEPKDGEPMAAFLGKATWRIAAGAVHEACSPLGLDEESTVLRLKDGSEVAVDKREDSRDEMMDGETVWHITYRFSSPTCPESAEADIELHMGGPVE